MAVLIYLRRSERGGGEHNERHINQGKKEKEANFELVKLIIFLMSLALLTKIITTNLQLPTCPIFLIDTKTTD